MHRWSPVVLRVRGRVARSRVRSDLRHADTFGGRRHALGDHQGRQGAGLRAALTPDKLRKYPQPLGDDFRAAAGEVLGIDPDSVLVGNGSDDVLTVLTRAFVPAGGLIASPTPSYLLYKTLAEIQGARFRTVPFTDDWRLPEPWPVPDAAWDRRIAQRLRGRG